MEVLNLDSPVVFSSSPAFFSIKSKSTSKLSIKTLLFFFLIFLEKKTHTLLSFEQTNPENGEFGNAVLATWKIPKIVNVTVCNYVLCQSKFSSEVLDLKLLQQKGENLRKATYVINQVPLHIFLFDGFQSFIS